MDVQYRAPYKKVITVTTDGSGEGSATLREVKACYFMRAETYTESSGGAAAAVDITVVSVYNANVDGPDLLGGNGENADLTNQYDSADISPGKPKMSNRDETLKAVVANGGASKVITIVAFFDPNVENV